MRRNKRAPRTATPGVLTCSGSNCADQAATTAFNALWGKRSDHMAHSNTSPSGYARLSHSPLAPASRKKAAIVTLLSWLLAWRPSATLVSDLAVLWMWHGFRRV